MKLFFRITPLFIFASFLFTTCKKENRCDCIKRTGEIISETRNISSFDKIQVEDNVNVFITEDPTFSVRVEAGKNIVPLIKTENNNGTLKIKNDNRCNWARSYDKPLNVYISMPIINYILSDGTGKITGVNPITTDSFDIRTKNSGDIELILNNKEIVSRMHGPGDIYLSGTTIEHSCDVGGSGFVYCENLNTNFTYIHSYTLGLCYIRCKNQLDCRINSRGDVHCYGNPPLISKSITNTGQLYLE